MNKMIIVIVAFFIFGGSAFANISLSDENIQFRKKEEINAQAFDSYLNGCGITVINHQATDHWNVCLDKFLKIKLKKNTWYKFVLEIGCKNLSSANLQFDLLDKDDDWDLIDSKKSFVFIEDLKTTIFLKSDRDISNALFSINFGNYVGEFFVKSIEIFEFFPKENTLALGYNDFEVLPQSSLSANFFDIAGFEDGVYILNPSNGNHWDRHFDKKYFEFKANQNYFVEAEIVSYIEESSTDIYVQILDDNPLDWLLIDEYFAKAKKGYTKIQALLSSPKDFIGRWAVNIGAREGLYCIKSLKIVECAGSNQSLQNQALVLNQNAFFVTPSDAEAEAENMTDDEIWVKVHKKGDEKRISLDLQMDFLQNRFYKIDFEIFYDFQDHDDLLIEIQDSSGNVLKSQRIMINNNDDFFKNGGDQIFLSFKPDFDVFGAKVSIKLGKKEAEYLVRNLNLIEYFINNN